jgi:hypothetical protein
MSEYRNRLFSFQIAGLLTGLFLNTTNAAIADDSAQQWGTPVNGLKLSLSTKKNESTKDISAIIDMQNVGDKDIAVVIGFEFPNGDKYPDSFKLILKDSKGKENEFELVGPPGIAGAAPTDYVVPLKKGATFHLEKSLKRYWRIYGKTHSNFDFIPGTRKGTSQLKVKLSNNEAERPKRAYSPAKLLTPVNSSKPVEDYLRWAGAAESNEVTLKF